MQEYRRQIAYLYAYEQGEQIKNAGFVKAEVRSGRCRIGIHLKRYGRGSRDMGKAYIYFGRQDRIIGICLGELESRNGALEWQGSLDPENILEKGIRFSETRGIWIRGYGAQDYVADWEDNLVDVSRFILYPKGGEKCMQCPRLGNCRRSVEDAFDKRGEIYERSYPAGT